MIITIAITKGGAGKSTLATNLAVCLNRDGHRVRVLDLDHKNQGSYSFFNKRDDKSVECILINNADELVENMEYDGITLIDTGAFDDDLTRAVISISDQLVVPFNPKSDKDAEGLSNFLDVLWEIEIIREQTIPTHLVATMIHPLRLPQQVTEDIKPILNADILLSGLITRRASYEHSGYKGNSVFETRDTKAMFEIKNLATNILKERLI